MFELSESSFPSDFLGLGSGSHLEVLYAKHQFYVVSFEKLQNTVDCAIENLFFFSISFGSMKV